MKTKTFDCVAMKRKAALRIAHELEGLDPAGQLAYWKRAHAELGRRRGSAHPR